MGGGGGERLELRIVVPMNSIGVLTGKGKDQEKKLRTCAFGGVSHTLKSVENKNGGILVDREKGSKGIKERAPPKGEPSPLDGWDKKVPE